MRGRKKCSCKGHTDSLCFFPGSPIPLHVLPRQRVSRASTERRHLVSVAFSVLLPTRQGPPPALGCQGPRVGLWYTPSFSPNVVCLHIFPFPAEKSFRAGLCLLLTSPMSPTLGTVLCKYLNEVRNIDFFEDLVILIMHLFSDPCCVRRHVQDTRSKGELSVASAFEKCPVWRKDKAGHGGHWDTETRTEVCLRGCPDPAWGQGHREGQSASVS